MLPVPSPGKGGGLVDKISNPSTGKLIITHRPTKLPRNRTESGRRPCEKKVNHLEEEKCSAILVTGRTKEHWKAWKKIERRSSKGLDRSKDVKKNRHYAYIQQEEEDGEELQEKRDVRNTVTFYPVGRFLGKNVVPCLDILVTVTAGEIFEIKTKAPIRTEPKPDRAP